MMSRSLSNAILLTIGITFGVVLTVFIMGVVSRNEVTAQKPASHDKKLIASHEPVAPPAQPPGAAAASAPELEQYKWLTPQDVAKEAAAKAAAAKPAPQAVPAPPKYTSSHVTYYVYGDPAAAQSQGAAPVGAEGASGISSPVDMTTTVSGYPIPVGSGPKAVEYSMSEPPPWTMGSNGLMQNPCVDPPSTRGRAFNRGTQF